MFCLIAEQWHFSIIHTVVSRQHSKCNYFKTPYFSQVYAVKNTWRWKLKLSFIDLQIVAGMVILQRVEVVASNVPQGISCLVRSLQDMNPTTLNLLARIFQIKSNLVTFGGIDRKSWDGRKLSATLSQEKLNVRDESWSQIIIWRSNIVY